ncbi:hypothetical protein [Bradyrhizobium sp. 2TAF24]|uniref:hypothetical protein n=1 Tax=Bradyrhizobium sp. 2TAF24 TaxID=3233011 RepID=UPI003F8FC736
MTERLARLLIMGVVTYGVMALIHYLWFSDVKPIAFAPEEQAGWRVDVASSLVAVEMVGGIVAALSAFFLVVVIWRQRQRRAS